MLKISLSKYGGENGLSSIIIIYSDQYHKAGKRNKNFILITAKNT